MFERYRGWIIAVVLVSVGAVSLAFLFLGSSSAAYACSSQLTPAPAATLAPGATPPPPLGQVTADLGRTHAATGSKVTYTYCPPASGSHYNANRQGPIELRFYNPGDKTLPQGWVHNLEHGAIVFLYRCDDACGSDTQKQLKGFYDALPKSTVCAIDRYALTTRFDTMKAPIAALAWDRVLFQDTLDTAQLLEFYQRYVDFQGQDPLERIPGCTYPDQVPSPSPSGAASPSPASSPGASPASSPAATPVPASPAPTPSPT